MAILLGAKKQFVATYIARKRRRCFANTRVDDLLRDAGRDHFCRDPGRLQNHLNMLRYKLRTLLIAMAIGPLLIAGACWSWKASRPAGPTWGATLSPWTTKPGYHWEWVEITPTSGYFVQVPNG